MACSPLFLRSPMATRFGTPWNAFNVSELLLKAHDHGSQITIDFGPSTYVYSQGHAWVNKQWQQVPFTCTGGQIVQNTWSPTSAQATLPQNSTFVVAYTCKQSGSPVYSRYPLSRLLGCSLRSGGSSASRRPCPGLSCSPSRPSCTNRCIHL